ncbi:MAG TPA: PIG-L family deacetylase [Candidatus Acidoferrales bacterium]|nr:PIG-L family deacetylase [Candidatus Acidoferrales bacterium]
MLGRRILVLVPHPDDEVVGCGAAIGRSLNEFPSSPREIFAAYLTTGVPSVDRLWPWLRKEHGQRVARRRQEARRAAELLGIQQVFFEDIPTRQLKGFLGPMQARLAEVIRDLCFDTLWTPAYEGGHQDHDVANFLASTLRNLVDIWEFSEYNSHQGRICSNEFLAPTGTEREIVLDPAERKRKRQLLTVYESERRNLTHVRTEREVFRPLANYDYSRPPHSGKLFYQRFQWVPYHPRVDHTRPYEVCRAIAQFAATQLSGRDVPRQTANSLKGGRS